MSIIMERNSMNKKDKEIMNLMNVIEHLIICDICGREDYSGNGYGEIEFSEDLYSEGWRVDKEDTVKCPKCVWKKKEKRKVKPAPKEGKISSKKIKEAIKLNSKSAKKALDDAEKRNEELKNRKDIDNSKKHITFGE